jgi:hypothetical protein
MSKYEVWNYYGFRATHKRFATPAEAGAWIERAGKICAGMCGGVRACASHEVREVSDVSDHAAIAAYIAANKAAFGVGAQAAREGAPLTACPYRCAERCGIWRDGYKSVSA